MKFVLFPTYGLSVPLVVEFIIINSIFTKSTDIMPRKLIPNLKAPGIRYRKGFFELKYIANSPEQIVKSSSKLSFIKHHKNENFVTSNTPFFKVELNYFNIAEGLWILYTESKYKSNIKLISQHDNSDPNSDDYYMLILSVNSDCIDLKLLGQKEKYTATNYYWGFFKPKNDVVTYNYKNSESKSITICFNKKWLDKNFAHLLHDNTSKLREFIESDKKIIVCAELNENLKHFFNEINTEFISFRKSKLMNLIQLQNIIYKLINCFVERIETEFKFHKNKDTTDDQRNLILKIERYLQSNLNQKFEGIEYLTKKFSISETALKHNFKRIFGLSVYQYFNKHQMLLAQQLLKKGKVPVKELAYNFGYESPGKFSEAFKKHIGLLPSEVK